MSEPRTRRAHNRTPDIVVEAAVSPVGPPSNYGFLDVGDGNLRFLNNDKARFIVRQVGNNVDVSVEVTSTMTQSQLNVVSVASVNGNYTIIGTSIPGSTVRINGVSAPVLLNATFTITAPLFPGVNVISQDSQTSTIYLIQDGTIPPVVLTSAVLNDSGTYNVIGSGRPGSIITIGNQTITIPPTGQFSLTNVIFTTGVNSIISGGIVIGSVYITPGSDPILISSITDNGNVTGTGPPGMTITIGGITTVILSDGTFSVSNAVLVTGSNPILSNNEVVGSVYVKSDLITVVATSIASNGDVTGIGPPGMTITIGEITTMILSDGTFSVLNSMLAPGVNSITSDGNIVGSIYVQSDDILPVVVDVIIQNLDGTYSISGTGPIDLTITVGGIETMILSDGTFSVVNTILTPGINPITSEGEVVGSVYVQSDLITIVVTNVIDNDGTYSITGVGPPNLSITVGGISVIIDSSGNFSILNAILTEGINSITSVGDVIGSVYITPGSDLTPTVATNVVNNGDGTYSVNGIGPTGMTIIIGGISTVIDSTGNFSIPSAILIEGINSITSDGDVIGSVFLQSDEILPVVATSVTENTATPREYTVSGIGPIGMIITISGIITVIDSTGNFSIPNATLTEGINSITSAGDVVGSIYVQPTEDVIVAVTSTIDNSDGTYTITGIGPAGMTITIGGITTTILSDGTFSIPNATLSEGVNSITSGIEVVGSIYVQPGVLIPSIIVNSVTYINDNNYSILGTGSPNLTITVGGVTTVIQSDGSFSVLNAVLVTGENPITSGVEIIGSIYLQLGETIPPVITTSITQNPDGTYAIVGTGPPNLTITVGGVTTVIDSTDNFSVPNVILITGQNPITSAGDVVGSVFVQLTPSTIVNSISDNGNGTYTIIGTGTPNLPITVGGVSTIINSTGNFSVLNGILNLGTNSITSNGDIVGSIYVQLIPSIIVTSVTENPDGTYSIIGIGPPNLTITIGGITVIIDSSGVFLVPNAVLITGQNSITSTDDIVGSIYVQLGKTIPSIIVTSVTENSDGTYSITGTGPIGITIMIGGITTVIDSSGVLSVPNAVLITGQNLITSGIEVVGSIYVQLATPVITTSITQNPDGTYSIIGTGPPNLTITVGGVTTIIDSTGSFSVLNAVLITGQNPITSTDDIVSSIYIQIATPVITTSITQNPDGTYSITGTGPPNLSIELGGITTDILSDGTFSVLNSVLITGQNPITSSSITVGSIYIQPSIPIIVTSVTQNPDDTYTVTGTGPSSLTITIGGITTTISATGNFSVLNAALIQGSNPIISSSITVGVVYLQPSSTVLITNVTPVSATGEYNIEGITRSDMTLTIGFTTQTVTANVPFMLSGVILESGSNPITSSSIIVGSIYLQPGLNPVVITTLIENPDGTYTVTGSGTDNLVIELGTQSATITGGVFTIPDAALIIGVNNITSSSIIVGSVFIQPRQQPVIINSITTTDNLNQYIIEGVGPSGLSVTINGTVITIDSNGVLNPTEVTLPIGTTPILDITTNNEVSSITILDPELPIITSVTYDSVSGTYTVSGAGLNGMTITINGESDTITAGIFTITNVILTLGSNEVTSGIITIGEIYLQTMIPIVVTSVVPTPTGYSIFGTGPSGLSISIGNQTVTILNGQFSVSNAVLNEGINYITTSGIIIGSVYIPTITPILITSVSSIQPLHYNIDGTGSSDTAITIGDQTATIINNQFSITDTTLVYGPNNITANGEVTGIVYVEAGSVDAGSVVVTDVTLTPTGYSISGTGPNGITISIANESVTIVNNQFTLSPVNLVSGENPITLEPSNEQLGIVYLQSPVVITSTTLQSNDRYTISGSGPPNTTITISSTQIPIPANGQFTAIDISLINGINEITTFNIVLGSIYLQQANPEFIEGLIIDIYDPNTDPPNITISGSGGPPNGTVSVNTIPVITAQIDPTGDWTITYDSTTLTGSTQLIFTDVDGNPSLPVVVVPIQLVIPDPPVVNYVNGVNPGDVLINITAEHTPEYTLDGGLNWLPATIPQQTIPPGTYTEGSIQVRQVDGIPSDAVILDSVMSPFNPVILDIDIVGDPLTSYKIVGSGSINSTIQVSATIGGPSLASTVVDEFGSFTVNLPATAITTAYVNMIQSPLSGRTSITLPTLPIIDPITAHYELTGNIVRIVPDQAVDWQYSLNGGNSWFSGASGGSSIPDGRYASNVIRVRRVNSVGAYSTSYSMNSVLSPYVPTIISAVPAGNQYTIIGSGDSGSTISITLTPSIGVIPASGANAAGDFNVTSPFIYPGAIGTITMSRAATGLTNTIPLLIPAMTLNEFTITRLPNNSIQVLGYIGYQNAGTVVTITSPGNPTSTPTANTNGTINFTNIGSYPPAAVLTFMGGILLDTVTVPNLNGQVLLTITQLPGLIRVNVFIRDNVEVGETVIVSIEGASGVTNTVSAIVTAFDITAENIVINIPSSVLTAGSSYTARAVVVDVNEVSNNVNFTATVGGPIIKSNGIIGGRIFTVGTFGIRAQYIPVGNYTGGVGTLVVGANTIVVQVASLAVAALATEYNLTLYINAVNRTPLNNFNGTGILSITLTGGPAVNLTTPVAINTQIPVMTISGSRNIVTQVLSLNGTGTSNSVVVITLSGVVYMVNTGLTGVWSTTIGSVGLLQLTVGYYVANSGGNQSVPNTLIVL